MRVLHINNNYIFTKLHQNMINELQISGIDNYVFVPVSNANSSAIIPNSNVNVVECFSSFDRFFFHMKNQKIQKAIDGLIDIKRFDCIHAYTLFTDGYCAMKMHEKYDVPYVVAVRNTDVNTFFKHMIHLRHIGVDVMKNAYKVFFLSDVYKKNVIDNYIPDKLKNEICRKSMVIPNGIDSFWHSNPYLFNDYQQKRNNFNRKTIRLVYAGSVNKNKNIKLTIKAIDILKQKGWNVEYTVIGSIQDKSLYNRYKKLDYVQFVKKLPKEELIKRYRDADIFVMPSHAETFGLVYAEAMSQGLPVIYTRGQGFDGQFEEGEVGYSVSDFNAEELANKVEIIISDYETISRRCVEKVNKFNWKRIAMLYKDIYNEIGGNK